MTKSEIVGLAERLERAAKLAETKYVSNSPELFTLAAAALRATLKEHE